MLNISMLKSLFHCLCFSILVILIIGCSKVYNTGNPSTSRAHVWKYLHSYNDENDGYATYSYVLVGNKNNEIYLTLVEEIQASTPHGDSINNYISSSYLNLFLIPVIFNSAAPNYELSKALLTILSVYSPVDFSNRPGPYIITLYNPINSKKNEEIADILYLDLTGISPKAISEIIRTYKAKVLKDQPDGIEQLQSLRLSFLNLALIAEESIGFAKVAYAELQKTFFDNIEGYKN